MHFIINYFKESWQELQKVQWPNREQTIQLSIAVIVFSAVFSIYSGALDYGYTQLLQRLITKG